MAGRKKDEASIKQMAYARALLGGQSDNKQQMALNAGYSPNVARSVSTHIEQKKGFHNAMFKLAQESNNLALAAMAEFKARGFEDFSNKELIGALNAIGGAWNRFNNQNGPKRHSDEGKGNRLRTLVLQRVENQTVIEAGKEERYEASEEIKREIEESVEEDNEDEEF